jgi:membrane protein YqaA with SNARE-associated domain
MRRFLVLLGSCLGGWAGWWLGARAGLVTAFFVSTIGTGLGVYLGWRIGREYFD